MRILLILLILFFSSKIFSIENNKLIKENDLVYKWGLKLNESLSFA